MRIALLQINPIVGDLAGNADKILAAAARAKSLGADLCITPELALLGYPPRDLLLFPKLVADCSALTKRIARELKSGPSLILGTICPSDKPSGTGLTNCAAVLSKGELVATYAKRLLPTYDVFDERRYFEPGDRSVVVELHSKRIALTVCEDIWNDGDFWTKQLYDEDPLKELPDLKADLLVNISASPFALGKQKLRQDMLAAIAARFSLPVAYANQVGGNDELVFDGRSVCVDAKGRLASRAKAFAEDIVLFDTSTGAGTLQEDDFTREAEAWQALVLGTRDYLAKTGFSRALLGLSGGVDSALTAAVACQALGPKNVLGVLMPSPYSSEHSIADARQLAATLGMETITIPIEPGMAAFDTMLADAFADRLPDVTEENIQARVRGNILMALSNKYGAILLTTGNKSELSVGYCTIYGDMSGGLAVISDLPKTLVYSLCHWLNANHGPTIPEHVLTKAPSAELRPDQTDQDSLPPYEVLDPILDMLIARRLSVDEITTDGHDRDLVQRVAKLVAGSEFKRRQAAPGLKITSRAFGMGWKMPIAAKYSIF